MNSAPDFFMVALDYAGFFDDVWKCCKVRLVESLCGRGLMQVRIDPPIPVGKAKGYDQAIEKVLLAPRHMGVTLHRIEEWPVFVHLCVPLLPGQEYSWTIKTAEGKYYSIVWAELYQSEAEARKSLRGGI